MNVKWTLDKVPFIMISGEKGFKIPFNQDLLSSQIDVAPTILSMLDLPIPITMWGRSWLKNETIKKPLAITCDYDGDIIFRFQDKKHSYIVPLNKENKEDFTIKTLRHWIENQKSIENNPKWNKKVISN